MTFKTTGQPLGSSCMSQATTGEMKITLDNVTRAGALQKRGFMLARFSRVFAVVALASLACVGMAQDEGEGATDEAAATAAAATDSPTTGSAEGVTLVASNMAVERVIGQLSDQTGVSISARGNTAGERVTYINPRPIPLRDALTQIVNSKPNWILYEPADRPGSFEIWDQETYRAEVLPRLVRPKVFVPREITAEEAAKALEGVMTPGIGKVAFDPRSNKVIMTDLVPVLELAQRLLQTIDVQFYTRVYSIEHADVDSVAEKLAALKSPASPDIQVDARTRQIIVSDRIDILQRMEQLVETLDIGPEMRVYSINNLGVEGEELEDLEVAIEEILTPEAYFHFNIRQGKLIVRDLPEVQERVEKILEAFDAPVQQILLQLEIIETEFSDGFNWSVDYAFSGDLLGAVTDGLVSGVPTGASTGEDGPIAGTEGFVNFRKEFPVVSLGSTGLDAQMLTRHAFVRLQAAMSDSRTRILQQPRMLVQNQKIASFDVGQSVPFFTGGSIGYNNNQGNLTPSQPVQQLLQVGLFVEVIPVISASGMVELEITVENSSPLRVEQIFGGQQYTGMGKTNQTLETTMWVPSGATRVIGGLVTDAKSETRSGIPGLSRIPYVGPALFGSYTRNPEDNRRRNLLIFITPTIVEETPSNPQKYKGVLMAEKPQDRLTTPTATISDLGSFTRGPQLEKGDYLGYTPPPLPDFSGMANTVDLSNYEEDTMLLSPPPSAHQEAPQSLSGIEASVNIQSIPGDIDVRNELTPLSDSSDPRTLPRVIIEENFEVDPVASMITTPGGPAGLLSTGSQNLVQPREAAPASNGAEAKEATPAASGGRSSQPARPPARETNHR